MNMRKIRIAAGLAATVGGLGNADIAASQTVPWPAEVAGWRAVAPGEHPRLLFRKADVSELRARAQTAEGQALLQRLRVLLDGAEGTKLPPRLGIKGPPPADNPGPLAEAPAGEVLTYAHPAGYGFLYQMTGDRRFADLGRQAMDLLLEGYRDRDQRYSFRQPGGALRAGPSLGWVALGYDLCYDGWDDGYRRKVAAEIANYNEGKWCSLAELARGARQFPGSNHWGMQVGGAALALLAVRDDPGVDMAKIAPLLEQNAKAMIRNVTEGFGDGGFFAEGDGTGSMASHIAYLPALQAWRVAGGKDFVTPRPNAQWTYLKWFFLTVPSGDPTNLRADFPARGGYPHNIWARESVSGAGYFSIAFGVATEPQKAAILWCYNRWLREHDLKAGTPFDATTPYPHHAILSYVNWPIGLAERDPDDVLPHAYRDTKWKFYAWRNRWQDRNDTVISILTHRAKGNMGAPAENTLTIRSQGRSIKWGRIGGGFLEPWAPQPDGSTVLKTGDGSVLAIDFSRASGADALLVMTGPGAPAEGVIEAGGTKFSLLLLGPDPLPKPRAEGNRLVIGGQTVSYDGQSIVLGK